VVTLSLPKSAARPARVGVNGADDHSTLVRDVVFAPIGGEGLANLAVRRIAEGIGLGLLREGDRLPSEIQLSEWLGISSLTLREALAILRQAGYIETLRGRNGGTFVRGGPSAPSAARAQQVLAELTPEWLQDLNDQRIAVSGHASALAAERATPQESAQIQELAEQMRKTKDYDAYRRLDATFHIGIAAASHSARLTALEAKLQTEIGEVFLAQFASINHKTNAILRSANREHKALAAAIADKDADLARSTMTSHANNSLNLQLALIAARQKR
jgi:GntR family transcriptional repressor for pyruvate dehydrogenase complex